MKKLLILFLVVMTTLTLSACKKDDKSISIALEATGDIPEKFQEQIDRFTEETGIEVKIQTYSGADNYEKAILGQIAGQQAPDVFWTDGGVKLREYAEAEAIQSLDDLVTMDLTNFETSLLDAFKYEDNLYGIPKDYNTTVLFYNNDLLDGSVPTTIEEFKTQVAASTTGTGDDKVYGFGMDPKLNYYLPFVFTMGANIISSDGSINDDELDSDEHKEALQLLKDMYDADQATSPFLASAGWDGELFGNNKVAMLYGGSWITGVIGEGHNASITSLPVKNEEASMLFVAGWVISSQSKNEDEAMQLIEFLSSDDELVQGNKDGLIGLPPTKTAMDKLIEEKSDDPYLPVYRDVVADGFAFGSINKKFLDSYNLAIENMLYDDVSVNDTITAIKDYE